MWLAHQSWTQHKGFKLAELIITHPHIDHLADIENVTRYLQPFMILRRKDLDWRKVTSGGSGQTTILTHYENTYMPPKYAWDMPVSEKPDWGEDFLISSYYLSEHRVAELSTTDSSYVNNSSYITILKYMNYCFTFSGDTETKAMSGLIRENQWLRSTISSGVDFFLTPHHGHSTGFSSEWFEIAGPTKIMNIASERRKAAPENESQTGVDSRYSQVAYCIGLNREGRRLVSTKADGHIHLWVSDDGKWGWESRK